MAALSGTIVLAADEWFRVDLVMSKLGAIGGSVVDERGRPMAGAYVRLLKHVTVGSQPQLAAGPITTADDRGEYRLTNLDPGRYIVSVPSVQHSVPSSASAAEIEGLTPDQLAALDRTLEVGKLQPMHRPRGLVRDGPTALLVGDYPTPPAAGDVRRLVYPPVFYPGGSTFSGAATIDLGRGEERLGVDLALHPVPSVRVAGRLQGELSDYSGIVLRLMPAGLEDLGVGTEVATTLVQRDGAFAFLGVPAGAYTLLAPGSSFEFVVQGTQGVTTTSAAGSPSLPLTPGLGRYGQGGAGGLLASAPGITYKSVVPTTVLEKGFARLPVVVSDRDVLDLRVPLQPTGSLTCRLVLEGVAAPPSSGLLQLTPADSGARLGLHNAAVRQGEALVRFRGLLPGEYALRKTGLQGFTLKAITTADGDYTRKPLVIRPGEDVTAVVTLTGEGIALSGVVHDRKGSPVPLASVIVFPTDQQLWTNYGFAPTWILASAGRSNGTYEIAGIRAGEYYVVAVASGSANAWADPRFLRRAASSAVRISLAWGDTRVLNLRLAEN